MDKNISQFSLQTLGLEPRDYTIYTALLKHEELSIRKIAELTRFNRGVVYNSLKKLQDLGLVKAQTSKKLLRYVAESPELLSILVNQKEQDVQFARQDVDSVVPFLNSLRSNALAKPKIGVYEGYEGINSLLRDILNTMKNAEHKLIYIYASQAIRQELYRFFEDYTSRRERYGIYAHVIAVGSGGGESTFSERRYVNAGLYDPTSYTCIYDNKMSILSISGKNEPYGILIEDEGVVAMQKMAFQIIWNTLK